MLEGEIKWLNFSECETWCGIFIRYSVTQEMVNAARQTHSATMSVDLLVRDYDLHREVFLSLSVEAMFGEQL